MPTEIICTIVTGIVSVVTCILAATFKAKTDKMDKRAERRKTESLLSLEMMSATLMLSEATANACLNRKNNGNVEKAYEEAAKARRKYIEFERQVLSEEI